MILKTFTFFVPGLPVAQPRTKATARKGTDGKFHGAVYTPSLANGWKATVALAARQAGVIPSLEAVEMKATFFFPRPKSHYRTNGTLKANAPKRHTKKPDRDNLEKAVMDAMKGIAWIDDSQSDIGRVEKRWCDEGKEPGVVITLTGEYPDAIVDGGGCFPFGE